MSEREQFIFTKTFISDRPINKKEDAPSDYDRLFLLFPEEAAYVYSFEKNRLIFAKGWKSLLGYEDEEISLQNILQATVPDYIKFSNDLNEKAIKFIMTQNAKNLEEYSFTIEIKKYHLDKSVIPMIARVGVLKAENGKPIEVYGRFQKNNNLKFGKVMFYAAYGPEKSGFEEDLNKRLFEHCAISIKERQALDLVSKGYTFKEIADNFNISQSAVEKRILPLYKRFNVKSLSHLVSFAFENNIIPIS